MSDQAMPHLPAVRPTGCPFDPPPEHKAWREAPGLQRVTWRDVPAWAVSRYEDVRTAMTHPAVSASLRNTPMGSPSGDVDGVPVAFPRMDDPEHARIRKLVTDEFATHRIKAMRPRLQEIADALIDDMLEKEGPVDLVTAYGLPIPSLAISALLGVPYEDHPFFQEQASEMFRVDATETERLNASAAIYFYLLEMAQKRQKEPGEGLISRSVHEHVAAGVLTMDDVAVNGMVLLAAGHETTANMIALGVLTLLEHPETGARVREATDQKVVADTVEELMRYLTIVQDLVVRVAREDVEIGGQLIRAGEGIIMNLPVADRDPAFFDDPDTFDIDRRRRGHVAFGYGPHQCLGQSLARAELEIAYTAILRRLPGLKLAIPLADVKFRDDMGTYGVHELPVTW